MALPMGELSAKLTERALSALRAPLPKGEAFAGKSQFHDLLMKDNLNEVFNNYGIRRKEN